MSNNFAKSEDIKQLQKPQRTLGKINTSAIQKTNIYTYTHTEVHNIQTAENKDKYTMFKEARGKRHIR